MIKLEPTIILQHVSYNIELVISLLLPCPSETGELDRPNLHRRGLAAHTVILSATLAAVVRMSSTAVVSDVAKGDAGPELHMFAYIRRVS